MSPKPISHSPDLKKLRDEGHNVEYKNGHVLIRDIPVLNHEGVVERGMLAMPVTLAGNIAVKPADHVVHFQGPKPHHSPGKAITEIINAENRREIVPGLSIDFTFSAKPKTPFQDNYAKAISYINILSGPARDADPAATAKTFAVVPPEPDDEIFNYFDTASSRAEIEAVTSKLRIKKVAIVGLGGTGSYILDLLAKAPIAEIHLFDEDTFLQHNAFRGPGAPTLEELQKQKPKVEYWANKYSPMRKGIIPHKVPISSENIEALKDFDFIFLSMDDGRIKKSIVEYCGRENKTFIDAGMGIYLKNGALGGLLRVTTSSERKRDHVLGKNRIPLGPSDPDAEYSKNIQVADLNALNAALVVIKWKRMVGFYHDFDSEHFSLYTIDGNCITNEDRSDD